MNWKTSWWDLLNVQVKHMNYHTKCWLGNCQFSTLKNKLGFCNKVTRSKCWKDNNILLCFFWKQNKKVYTQKYTHRKNQQAMALLMGKTEQDQIGIFGWGKPKNSLWPPSHLPKPIYFFFPRPEEYEPSFKKGWKSEMGYYCTHFLL